MSIARIQHAALYYYQQNFQVSTVRVGPRAYATFQDEILQEYEAKTREKVPKEAIPINIRMSLTVGTVNVQLDSELGPDDIVVE
jgi:hypothetical protein